jgi:hypothetical protein
MDQDELRRGVAEFVGAFTVIFIGAPGSATTTSISARLSPMSSGRPSRASTSPAPAKQLTE